MVRLESRRWKLKADSEGSAPSSASCSLLEKERGRKDRTSLAAMYRRTARLPDRDPGTVMGAQLNPREGAGSRAEPQTTGQPRQGQTHCVPNPAEAPQSAVMGT